MPKKTQPAATATADSWTVVYQLDNFGDASEASGGLDFTGAATGTQNLTDSLGSTVQWDWRNGTQPTTFGIAAGGALQNQPEAVTRNFWSPASTGNGGQFGVRLDRIYSSLGLHDDLCIQVSMNPATGVTGSGRKLHMGAMVTDGTLGAHTRYIINESGTDDYLSGNATSYAAEVWNFVPRLLEFRLRIIDEGGTVMWSTEAPGGSWPTPGRTGSANDIQRGLRRRGALDFSNSAGSLALDDTYLWLGVSQNSGTTSPSQMDFTGIRFLRLKDA